jgi:predicted membrane channel-forming protein YqfA (hemolysin III family)
MERGVFAYGKAAVIFPSSTLMLIATGGALYTLGVLFHSWELLRFQNAIWHGVVLGVLAFTAVAGSKSFSPLPQQHPHRFMTRSPD